MSVKNKILLINPYYGKWPVWLPAFLLSCKANPDITWLIPTDCDIPREAPDNVIFVKSTLQALSKTASDVTGLNIDMQRPYKLNDIRPLFGKIFGEELKDYDFWGHCDIDVIFGDIRSFITDDILNNHDVISARKGAISGHFTLYRNVEKINKLYLSHPIYQKAFLSPTSFYFDEVGMTEVIKKDQADGAGLRVYWPDYLLNFKETRKKKPSYVPKVLNHWRWHDGKLFEEGDKGGEIMYLHFMTWKKTLQHCFVDYKKNPRQFYISYTHISERKTPLPADFAKIPVSRIVPSMFR
ncbi:hypothetical protein IT774_04250 [Salinimonas marina]|uniref:Glycosyl transferase n=1 Tax=Salinimonas marina TaxID=2785918 RepID=A0A7S9HDP0_9ALTE|nr:DUF6625 family protein [Salinimonas marina]QPG06410.1 hypothetical protein IT774_04250 [Salinimonas marina]